MAIHAARNYRGDRLVRAGKGVLFSTPELVFVNIRKGSFDAATLRRAGQLRETAEERHRRGAAQRDVASAGPPVD
jgi:hypothetical protein